MKTIRNEYPIRESSYLQIGAHHIYVTVKRQNDGGADPDIRGKYVWDLVRMSIYHVQNGQKTTSTHYSVRHGKSLTVTHAVDKCLCDTIGDYEWTPNDWKNSHINATCEVEHIGTFARGTHGQEFARRLEFEWYINETEREWLTQDVVDAVGDIVVSHNAATGKSIFARLAEPITLTGDFEDGEIRLIRKVYTDRFDRASSIDLRLEIEYDDDRRARSLLLQNMMY